MTGDPEGLDQNSFRLLIERMGYGAAVWTMTDKDGRPVGVVVGYPRTEIAFEPHVRWFPWASPRNRLECALRFIRKESKAFTLLIFTRPEERNFWQVMARYGVLRKVNPVYNLYRKNDTVDFWQSL